MTLFMSGGACVTCVAPLPALPKQYMVQLFSWLDGRATEQKLVTLAEMEDWKFYNNRNEWIAASGGEEWT